MIKKNILFIFTPLINAKHITESFLGIPYAAAQEVGHSCTVLPHKDIVSLINNEDIYDYNMCFGNHLYTRTKLREEADIIFSDGSGLNWPDGENNLHKVPDNVLPVCVFRGYIRDTLFFCYGLGKNNVYTSVLPSILTNLEQRHEVIVEWLSKAENLLTKREQFGHENSMNVSKVNSSYPKVFLPMQFSNDMTLRACNFDYHKFAINVATECAKYDLSMTIKMHPHAYENQPGEKDRINHIIKDCAKICGVTISFGEIRQIMKQSLFTVVANSESLSTDAFISGSDIVSCSPNIFMETDAVIYEEDLSKSFKDIMVEHRKCNTRSQQMLIWWISNYLLFHKNDLLYNTRSCVDRLIGFFVWLGNDRSTLLFPFSKYYDKKL